MRILWNKSACAQAMLAALLIFTLMVAILPTRATAAQPTVDELKARIASTDVRDRPRLCVEIAELQLRTIDKLYAASDDAKAQAALTDIVAYSELARDYAIQSHKYQKQAEIAVRGMTRKLNDVMHTLPHTEQAPLQDAILQLQQVRDDLLASMFPKGVK
jgi:hypothetical protein